MIENPLESSVEMGVDVTMSNSLNDNTGGELMAKHIGKMGLVEGAGLVSAPTELNIGGHGSAFSFFKPITRLSLETDEQKLSKESADRLHPLYKPTPAPRILLNEREIQLSPSSPSPLFGLHEHPEGGSPLKKVQTSQLSSNEDMASDSEHLTSSLTTTRRRGESISQLQKLHHQIRAPRLGGRYMSSLKASESLFVEGKKFIFRVTILQATGIPRDFTDVFVQFKFLNGNDVAFSTEPLKNENQDLALGFYHMQNLSVTVNPSFIYYLQNYPLVLEVFGHYQQHPLHKASTDFSPSRSTDNLKAAHSSPMRHLVSSPVRSDKAVVFDSTGLTPQNGYVFCTLSAYIELKKCSQPACFTKDLCLRVYSRESKPTISRSFFSRFTGIKQSDNDNCSVGIYELCLRKTVEKAQDYQPPVVDTSTVYVRGEENLTGGRPRSESLIYDHQEQMDKLHMLEETEKARHILQVRQKILEMRHLKRGISMPTDQELNKLSDEHKATLAQKCVDLLTKSKQDGDAQTVTSTSATDSSQSDTAASFTATPRSSP